MLWDYCRIFCLLLFGTLFLEASNEDHQPFGPGERPALINLNKMETVYVDHNWGPIKTADVRQMEGYPAPYSLPYREALYPIKSSKYKHIALRSFVDGDYEFLFDGPGKYAARFLVRLKGEQIHEGFTTATCLEE